MRQGKSFFFFALISFAFLSDSIGIIRCCVLFSVLHEAGHALVWYLLTKEKPKISCSVGGFSLKYESIRFTRKQETILLIAGPAVNFVFFIAGCVLLSFHACINYYLLTAVNLFIGLFNLFPFSFLDGGKLLYLWIPSKYNFMLRMIQILFMLLIFVGFILFLLCNNSPVLKLGAACLLFYFFIKRGR